LKIFVDFFCECIILLGSLKALVTGSELIRAAGEKKSGAPQIHQILSENAGIQPLGCDL
jgi:hypothetical protein